MYDRVGKEVHEGTKQWMMNVKIEEENLYMGKF
jgi:hypothetical protein